jgi:hypothetical protein
VEEDVGFLAVNGDIGGASFGDWIWRCSDILGMLVLVTGLRSTGADCGGPSNVLIWYGEL